MNTVVKKWTGFYKEEVKKNSLYPENFVTRVFLSTSPVQFLDRDYKGKKILDLGCGHGRHIPFLSNLDFDLTGMEVSEQHISSLTERFPEQHFVKGLAHSMPFSDDEFDFILACNSIYYLTSSAITFEQHIRECIRVLRADGHLIFSMLGNKHSVFDDAIDEGKGVYKIEIDFLGFRNGVSIQTYQEEVVSTIFDGLKILHQGEVLETVGSNCRHFYYFVAQVI